MALLITAVAAWRSVAIGHVDSCPSWSTSIVGARSSDGNRRLDRRYWRNRQRRFRLLVYLAKGTAIRSSRFCRQSARLHGRYQLAWNSRIHTAGLQVPIDHHPFPMFEANVSQIGLLPADLAGEVAGFYSHARGIVRDFLTINKGEPILILRDPYDVGWMAKRLLTSRTEPYLGARVAHIEAKSVV